MNDIEIKKGDTWVNKLDETNTVTLATVGAFSVTGSSSKDGGYMASRHDFLHYFKPSKQGRKDGSQKPKHSHYHKDVSQYDTIDVYAVCKIFDVQDTSGCLQHAIKKLLVTGQRGHKDRQTDIQNAIDTLNRLLELEHGKDK